MKFVVNYSDSSSLDIFDKKIYQINNPDLINDLTIEQYLKQNFIITDTYDVFTKDSNSNNYSINMNDSIYSIYDGENTPALVIYKKQSVTFRIKPIVGDEFYFLKPASITLAESLISITYSPSSTFNYPSIDNNYDDNYDGNSKVVDINLPNNTSITWTSTTITVDINCSDYYTGTKPSLTITVNNVKDDGQIYATKLGSTVNSVFNYDINQVLSPSTAVPILKNLI
jgi:hypothetical protein